MKRLLWVVLVGVALLAAESNAQTAVVVRSGQINVGSQDGGVTVPVSGTVTAACTGTFWQTTQPVSGSVSVSGTATVTQGTSRDGGYDWGVNVDNWTADAGPLTLDSVGNLNVNLNTLLAGENVDAGWLEVNPAARLSGVTTEVLLIGDAGPMPMPATALVNRKAVEVQNAGPAALKCRAGSGSYLREIAADGTWSLDVADTIVVGCYQNSGTDFVTGNAVVVTEIK